jgi:hypothetical protein
LEHDRALVTAMPLRHLEAARGVCEERGLVTLPAGGPGDLGATPEGTTVLLIATEAGDLEVPAATWRAVFGARVAYATGDPWPDGLPATWTAEHPTPGGASGQHASTDHEDDDENDEREIGPQSFFEVRQLGPSPRDSWVYANELVPKQLRGGRTFVPRTPRLIHFVD